MKNAMVSGQLSQEQVPHSPTEDPSELDGVSHVSHDALTEVIHMRSEIAGLERALRLLKGLNGTDMDLTSRSPPKKILCAIFIFSFHVQCC